MLELKDGAAAAVDVDALSWWAVRAVSIPCKDYTSYQYKYEYNYSYTDSR